MFIYKFTNPRNNKAYIGKWVSTVTRLQGRYKREILSENNRGIVNALRKHGIENIKFEIIKETDNKEELKYLEIYFIKHFDTLKYGYNETVGGDGGPGSKKGWKMSEEGKKKISLAKKGKPSWNKGIKTNKPPWNKGLTGLKRFVSEEEKQKLRERIITYNKSQTGRENSRKSMINVNKIFRTGSHHSQETKNKIGISRHATWIEAKRVQTK